MIPSSQTPQSNSAAIASKRNLTRISQNQNSFPRVKNMLNMEGISSQDSAFNGEIMMQPSQISAEHSSSMNEPPFNIGGIGF